MAIEGNSSAKVVTNEQKLYTGLCNMQVIAINPTKEQAEKLGFKYKEEIDYIGTDKNGKEYSRLDFYLKHKATGIIVKHSFFLRNEQRISTQNTSNKEFINDYGQNAWGSSPEQCLESMKWLKAEGLRPAFAGEPELIAFIQKWCNVPVEGKVRLDTVEKIIAGNIEELKQIWNQFKENEIKILLLVRDEKYHAVYPNHFGRAYETSIKFWKSALEKKPVPKEHSFQNDLEFKAFKYVTNLGEPSPNKPTQQEFTEDKF